MVLDLFRKAALVLLLAPGFGRAQAPADRAAVERAVLDYVEGFYEGDTAKLVRSVRPEVTKYGFYVPRDSTRYVGEAMPWPEFLSYARSIRERNRPTAANAPKQEVDDSPRSLAVIAKALAVAHYTGTRRDPKMLREEVGLSGSTAPALSDRPG